MADNKTKPTKVSVAAFIDGLTDEAKRADAKALVKLMQGATGERAKMWGPSIIGFGSYHYTYESGREGDMPLAGFSPRKAATVVYGMTGFSDSRRCELRSVSTLLVEAASTSRTCGCGSEGFADVNPRRSRRKESSTPSSKLDSEETGWRTVDLETCTPSCHAGRAARRHVPAGLNLRTVRGRKQHMTLVRFRQPGC